MYVQINVQWKQRMLEIGPGLLETGGVESNQKDIRVHQNSEAHMGLSGFSVSQAYITYKLQPPPSSIYL